MLSTSWWKLLMPAWAMLDTPSAIMISKLLFSSAPCPPPICGPAAPLIWRTPIAPISIEVIKFAPAPRVTADGPRAGSAWNDYYMIPATTTNDPDLIFRVIMEAADERSQQDAAEIGMATRLSVAEYGGAYLDAVGQTIAEGIGIYDKNPAVGIAVAKLGELLTPGRHWRNDCPGSFGCGCR